MSWIVPRGQRYDFGMPDFFTPPIIPKPNKNPYTGRNEKRTMATKESREFQQRRSVQEALDAVQEAQAVLGAAKQALERVRKNYPDFAAMNDSTVIAFSLRMDTFGGIRKTYHYAARKVMGRWYTTGSTCPAQGHSNAQLVTLLDKGELDGKIKVLS